MRHGQPREGLRTPNMCAGHEFGHPSVTSTFTPRIFPNMRLLCVGRHPFLSEHFARFFEALDVEAIPCVGMTEAEELVRRHEPDAIVCDYDLLATFSLSSWEGDPALADVPFIAVSLTRHPGEAHLLDVNGI